MPALGTHQPLGPAECRLMFGDAIDPARLLHHRWRDDVTTIGELSADEVDEIVGRSLGLSLPFAVNRVLVDGSYDLVVSVGQVVPHEVAGFGGYTKHVSIGLGGPETIQRSHFFSAVYGIEQTHGTDRRARSGSCSTVASIASSSRAAVCCSCSPSSRPATTDRSCAASSPARAAPARPVATRSARRLRCRPRSTSRRSTTPFRRCVAYLDPTEYRSTWLGNKAIYRTRLAMADGGELFVARAGRVALRRGPARRHADPPARLSRARRGARGDGGRPRARGEPRGGCAPDPRLDRGPLHRHLRARPRALARRRRRRRVRLPAARRGARAVSRDSTSRRHRRRPSRTPGLWPGLWRV